MIKKAINNSLLLCLVVVSVWSCTPTLQTIKTENNTVPASYSSSQDSVNSAQYTWREYFSDPHLIALIDTALKNNQEMNILLQEIEISKNEVRARKGEYLPTLGIGAGAGFEKSAAYTRNGAVEENLEIKEGTVFPEPLPDFMFGAYAKWEVDIWKKLHNAKKSAMMRYLGSVEGKNFMATNLVAEIAEAYYELMALDNQLGIIEQNIQIQSNALNVVKQQKLAAKVSQLAVNRFEAQLLNTQNLQFEIKQQIIEKENRINFLTGRYPVPITRSSAGFNDLPLDTAQEGIPSQLLVNRPDIRQAELQLEAAKLDIKVARANFYPNFGISAGVGFQAFNPAFIIQPKSLLYNLAGELMAPLVNRNGIKANYYNANAKQIQAIYSYEQTILNAYVDVLNQVAKLDNYAKSYETKSQEVELLVQSVTIAGNLFNSARADYGEVLFTQREALESKMDLIEIKMKQLSGKVNIYRALGGGWK